MYNFDWDFGDNCNCNCYYCYQVVDMAIDWDYCWSRDTVHKIVEESDNSSEQVVDYIVVSVQESHYYVAVVEGVVVVVHSRENMHKVGWIVVRNKVVFAKEGVVYSSVDKKAVDDNLVVAVVDNPADTGAVVDNPADIVAVVDIPAETVVDNPAEENVDGFLVGSLSLLFYSFLMFVPLFSGPTS